MAPRIVTLFSVFFLTATSSATLLKNGPGQDKVLTHCQMCHSLDYIEMNAHFLGEAGWNAEITKMINAFGAPIPPEDIQVLLKYLSTNY